MEETVLSYVLICLQYLFYTLHGRVTYHVALKAMNEHVTALLFFYNIQTSLHHES